MVSYRNFPPIGSGKFVSLFALFNVNDLTETIDFFPVVILPEKQTNKAVLNCLLKVRLTAPAGKPSSRYRDLLKIFQLGPRGFTLGRSSRVLALLTLVCRFLRLVHLVQSRNSRFRLLLLPWLGATILIIIVRVIIVVVTEIQVTVFRLVLFSVQSALALLRLLYFC